jgi:hypothetical protein
MIVAFWRMGTVKIEAAGSSKALVPITLDNECKIKLQTVQTSSSSYNGLFLTSKYCLRPIKDKRYNFSSLYIFKLI